MLQNNEATRVPEQGALPISTQLAAIELPVNPSSTNESVREIAPGEYVDPRIDVTGKHNGDHGEQINKWGKQQRSITILLPDGSTMVVSAFGAKAKKLEGLKLGYTYTFKGILKIKTEPFQGKEKTSHFLNL